MIFNFSALVWILWHTLNLPITSAVPRNAYSELKLFLEPATYNVDTTVLLNDVSRKDKDIGYKIKASLDVSPEWSNGQSEFLLKFDLVSPQLHSRSTHISADFVPHSSLWDSYPHSTFYAHWINGQIKTAYLDENEPDDVYNYKKSLISLFQFQLLDGEQNETDISGTCRVLYETVSMHTIRKFKSDCRSPDGTSHEGAESRRLVRYSLSAALDSLDELYAEELHALGEPAAHFALKARVLVRLQRAAARRAARRAARSLRAALAALPRALAPRSLRLRARAEPAAAQEARDAWAAAAGALRGEAPGAGGDAAAARAALRALPALRRAARGPLLALLHAERDAAALVALCRLLGLAGSAAAHGAAAAFLQLHDADPLDALAREYLAALALSDAPHEEVISDVLKLGESPWGEAAGALLAAAAAAPRAGERAERAARERLVGGLAKCKDERCRAARLDALGNLRRADTADALLAQAERGARGGEGARTALRALRALGALPAAAPLDEARLRRLEALALNARGFDVRAAALELLVARGAALPLELLPAAAALARGGAPELRRVFWQRLRSLRPQHEPLRALWPRLPLWLVNWDAQAIPGTSSVLRRHAGGAQGGAGGGALAAGGRRALLDSLQVARGGLLRRGRVALLTLDRHNATDEALVVELWARGLEALAGSAEASEAGDAEQAEEASGELELTVGGALLPALPLFSGQAELLAHVWAGRGSAPTAVLRALRPLAARAGLLPLGAGVALHWRTHAAFALALDAQAQASLWSRSARSHLELRAALAADCEARAGSLQARAELDADARLRITADLDFYDGVSLCVRAELGAQRRSQRVRLEAGGPRRVRRARDASWAAPGRTLALGAPNDLVCRTLGSADEE